MRRLGLHVEDQRADEIIIVCVAVGSDWLMAWPVVRVSE